MKHDDSPEAFERLRDDLRRVLLDAFEDKLIDVCKARALVLETMSRPEHRALVDSCVRRSYEHMSPIFVEPTQEDLDNRTLPGVVLRFVGES